MAYQAKKNKKVIEDFELVNEKGYVEHTLHVELDAGTVAEKIRRKYIELVRVQKECADITPETSDESAVLHAYEEIGFSVSSIIESVFGSEDAKVIFDFYEDNYAEMAKEVIPFISGVILPKMNKIVRENKKHILAGYNRRQCRNIMKVMR